jgi:dTDP-4-dehydrorhamnose reductase
MKSMRILILGAAGMLGHTLLNELSKQKGLTVYGTVRCSDGLPWACDSEVFEKIIQGVDVENFDTIIQAMASARPDVVINCIGLIKRAPRAEDPLSVITINAKLPHRISLVCKAVGARMIHFSTDCVYDGTTGNYPEEAPANATDLYGRTKFLGEVKENHCVTVRTSIIGHELQGKRGLLEWFLAQEGPVRGFTRAIFSGFPTVEIARILAEYIFPNYSLYGLYHVSSEPISKHELLSMVAQQYGKEITIEPYDGFVCDRSLDSSRFRQETGYSPPSWKELVKMMYDHYRISGKYSSRTKQ